MNDGTVAHLPAEIVHRIFYILWTGPESTRRMYWHNTKPLIVPLLRVCKSWNQAATPLLYRRLSIYFAGGNSTRAGNTLFKTLRSNARFYSYIRELDLYGSSGDSTDHVELFKKASHNLTSLKLTGECIEEVKQEVLSRINAMKLESLYVGREWSEPVVKHFMLYGGPDTLRNLDIDGHKHGWDPPDPAIPSATPSAKRSLSSIQHLEIDLAGWPLYAVQSLASLPRSLRSLKLDATSACSCWCEPTGACYIGAVQRILNLHRESLQNIELSQIIGDDDGILVDLSAFPNITSLELQYYNLFEVSPEEAFQKLPCPKLQRLSIDMNVNDQQHTGYNQLKDEKMEWLINFIRCRREHLPADMLQEIHIVYYFTEEDVAYNLDTWTVAEDSPWPVDHLVAAAERLKPLGIKLSWPEQRWTREEWAAELKSQNVPVSMHLDTNSESSPTPVVKEADETVITESEQERRKICEFMTQNCDLHPKT